MFMAHVGFGSQAAPPTARRGLRGIAKAKAEGVYKGRPASIDAAQVREKKAQGFGATEIAKALKIGWASVYRVLQDGMGEAKRTVITSS
jgi:DNA invertase Pin-like site-specific DNA recombinase